MGDMSTPFNRFLQASNTKSEQVWCSLRFPKRDGKAKKGRGVEEREREPASGRGARSSRLLRCSSCIHHLQNSLV